jgi:hypothetical protein
MNQNYKKFKDKFSEEGQKEFYSKIESMKNHLENVSNFEIKNNIEKNISSIVSSYEKMKKYYFECLEHEKKIKEKTMLGEKLGFELFNKKMEYLKKTGFMHGGEFDKKFGLSNN